MQLVISIIACAVLAYACAPTLRKHALTFYIATILLDVLFLTGGFSVLPAAVSRLFLFLMRRGILAMALFIVVMYIGVLWKNSPIRLRLASVRAELSIIACILIAAHVASYFSTFFLRMAGGALQYNLLVSALVGVVLLVLLIVLGATSFNVIRSRMDAHRWKAVQRFAYLFYGLVYVHIVLMFAPSALSGGAAAQANIAIYSIIFIVYAIARFARYRADKKQYAQNKRQAVARI